MEEKREEKQLKQLRQKKEGEEKKVKVALPARQVEVYFGRH